MGDNEDRFAHSIPFVEYMKISFNPENESVDIEVIEASSTLTQERKWTKWNR